ncbi:TonB-dependent receptor domain-containing protein [Porphyrobacter sp. TH134]|uniref:TonB-dependent receptor domain-containing protein n=1 Tax=Porphyrobacter sp. TH134 TaxID=2067450 RepID=UPI001F1F0D1C|nr:TonB-dependent receptor [Porphyrobacter sp. TH134]
MLHFGDKALQTRRVAGEALYTPRNNQIARVHVGGGHARFRAPGNRENDLILITKGNTVFQKQLLRQTGWASLAIALASTATPAIAQDAAVEDAEATAEASESIVVTGSRISNPNLELSSPVSFVSEDDIAFQQPVSIEQVLRQLPSAVPSIGAQTNNGNNGSSRLNLRGLGTNRNVILLNGRRVTPRDTDGVVDLNVIPIALLKRVDVLTGGASTVYGADAVAGVVNFITRDDFEGFDARFAQGITERGDGENFRADLTMGASFDDGRGNAVLSFGYVNTKPVLQGNRDFSLVSRSSVTGGEEGSPGAVPASIGFPFIGRVTPDGQFAAGAQNNYNFNPLNIFQTPQDLYSIYTQANYEITDGIEAYAEGMYVKSVVEVNLAPSGSFGNTVTTPLNSPFLSAQQRDFLCNAAVGVAGSGIAAGTDCGAAIAAGTPVTVAVNRRFVESGPRIQRFETDMFNLTGGFRGGLTDTLNWDVHGTYGRSNGAEQRTNWYLLSRLRAGVAGCPTGSAAGCVPFNVFGPEGSITQEMLNSIEVPTRAFRDTTFLNVAGTIDGDFGVASPFAETPISFALGAEYRRYTAGSEGDGISRVPGEVLGAGAAALPIRGDFNSKEFFLEAVAPLVEDKPFFYNLTLEGGVRYADYSTVGGTWTWKAGGSWSPIEEIKFRGVYTQAIRAPNIAELFQPQVTGLTGRTSDPCQGTLAAVTARGANFPDLCRAQLALVGAPTTLLGSIPGPAAGQIQQTTGGNPDLDAERARTLTAGVVFTPDILSSFSFSVDYFRIKVTDAITTPTQGDIIDGCFQPTPVPGTCDLTRRNPLDGSLSGPANTTFGPFLGLSNLGTIETSGIDFALNAAQDFDFGQISIGTFATYTMENLFQATPRSINRECVGYFSVNCGNPQPEVSATTRLTYTSTSRETDVSLFWRYLSAVEVEPVAPNPQLPTGTPTTAGPAAFFADYRNISSFNYFDLALRQAVIDNLTLTLSVQNLFDRDPPIVGAQAGGAGPNSGNTFPAVYDPLGRRFVVGVQFTF